MTRIVVIDPQPAVRAGLAMMLRSEPGFVPVGSAVGAGDGMELVERQRPDVVLMDPRLMDGDGLAVCRRMRSLDHPPRVVLYVSEPDDSLPVTARVAGADGLVDKAEPAEALYTAIRVVARGGVSLPAIDREELEKAAHRVDPDDLALLAMLMDHTSPAEAAETLHLDGRKVGRRVEALLGRLRSRKPRARAHTA